MPLACHRTHPLRATYLDLNTSGEDDIERIFSILGKVNVLIWNKVVSLHTSRDVRPERQTLRPRYATTPEYKLAVPYGSFGSRYR